MFKVKAQGQCTRSKRTEVNVKGQGLRSGFKVNVQDQGSKSKRTEIKVQGQKGRRSWFKIKVQCPGSRYVQGQKAQRSLFKVKVKGKKDGCQGSRSML